LELLVNVGEGARVQLTTTSATRLYHSREGAPPAFQSNNIFVEEGGLLEYIPDALIPFAGSRYRQETRIALANDAGLFWWEIVAPGREARGELFAYDLLQLHTDIVAGDRLILRERARLEPSQRPMNASARLGNYRYMASFYICKTGLNAAYWSGLEAQLQEQAKLLTDVGAILWGVSSLPAHGFIVRALAMRGRDIYPGLFAFWKMAKQALYGLDTVLPRKIW
jgi:urease accessory protein